MGGQTTELEMMKLRLGLRVVLVAGTLAIAGLSGVPGGPPTRAAAEPPHNVIIFVADGLRSRIVDAHTAPGLQAVREQGVDFVNSHSLFPTITTPNASAIATGHRLGDTGDFGNMLYFGAGFAPPYSSPVAAARGRRRPGTARRPLRRRLPAPEEPARGRPREGLEHGRHRQARSHRDPGRRPRATGQGRSSSTT